jgi:hypothetical protein
VGPEYGKEQDGFILPAVTHAALRDAPCQQFMDFLPRPLAEALYRELALGMVYEKVELGALTRQRRAVRPLGDVYYGRMERSAGWTTPSAVEAALAWFEKETFLDWLSDLAGERIAFRRPVTAYRMDRGDRLCLHDDVSDPDHAISIVYYLTPIWQPQWGGATVFGVVTEVNALPTPPDSPIDWREWRIRDPQRFTPQFNSLLVMRLDERYAHGVDEILADCPRFALVGIYARSTS